MRAIETGRRVYLRAPRESDRDEFVRRARASRELHRPWVYAPETSGQFDAYLLRCGMESERSFLVCTRDDDAIAGVFNLSQIAHGFFESAYLGYYAFASHAGRGLMAEGLELVLRHTFRELKLHRLEANIQPGNDASKRLVERAGFRYEGYSERYLKIGGRWRDHERWAITREDWR
ncbi:MAG TPA: GNAT family protein [Polyangiaceae bacterium]|nr:GNAT family protein [Polyangiaceae bacterium]